MRKLKKTAAAAISFAIAASGCLSAHGAGYDESLYVNMDHYGNIYEQRIIKGFALDGEDELIDYGNYKEVINKSSYAKPNQLFDKVKFDVKDVENSRFYFEAVPESLNAEIPWNINVSYRLNGVEKKVEELEGACGLIEINADIIPNENTSEYFKNNMVMTVAAAIDMDKHLSMEAEGAQVQAFGNYKAVLYLVLPGEEKSISIKIGSEDFEFLGLVFIMAPATLDQLEKIADLREAKETLEDSARTMNESVDIILDTLDGMKSGIDQTSQGLRELDSARQTVSDSKESLFYEAERAMEEFENLIESSMPYDEHVENAENALADLNDSVKSVQRSVDDLSNDLMSLKRVIRNLQKDVNDLNHDLDYARYDVRDAQTRVKRVRSEFDDLDKAVKHLDITGRSLEDALTNSVNAEEMLAGIIGSMDNPQMQITLATYMNNIKTLIGQLKYYYGGAIDSDFNSVKKESKDIYDNVGYMLNELDNALSHAYEDVDDVQDLLDDADALGNVSVRIIDSADNVVSDIDNMLTVLDDNYDGTIDTMEDVRDTLKATQRASAAIDNFMRNAESTAKESADDADNGLKDTLNGLADVLDNSSVGLGQTGIIRNAKNTVKDLIDDKWEEYTGGENNLLYVDPSQEKVSLTSSKNPEPETIQIILRTDEITNDKDDEKKDMDEEFHSEGTFFSRLKNIFGNIFGRGN
ncbi:MAG: hypothetical protein IKD83_08740 [Firmicutes bacterium]|nr:hypothetical protein [Bacillota bacterium]